jgi:hypothetical protein
MQAVVTMVHTQPFNRLDFLFIHPKGSAKRRAKLVGLHLY